MTTERTGGRWSTAAAVVTALAVLLIAPALAQAAAGWARGAPMEVDRKAHTMTVLRDGDVLVTGGQQIGGSPDSLTSVERYHPATDSWRTVAPLLHDRLSQTATLLPDGRVLVTGGVDTADVALASTELYDPAHDTWTAGPPMTAARRGHTATLLPDGRVLVAGGSGQNSTTALASAELYDPVANSWTATGPMTGKRRLHAAAPSGDGRVVVAGGYTTAFTPTATVELYDPATGTWSAGASMTNPRADFPLVELTGGSSGLAAVGGWTTDTVERYDVGAAWNPFPSLMGVRWANSATVLRSGDVLATGSDSSTELLTPGAAAWRYAGDLPSGGSPISYEQRLLNDGRVMLTGTCGDCGASDENVALYTPATTVEAGPDADFGDVYAGRRSPLLWVTVENTGRDPLLLDGVTVGGGGAADFAAERDGCSTGPVDPGARCRIGVRFTPGATGAAHATLTIAGNDPSGPAVVALDGVGVAAPTGPAGSDGADGRDGNDGADGRDGNDGAAGRDGDDGAAGRDGNDGAAGRDGNDGAAGRDGAAGPAGPTGPAGRDGATGPAGPAGAAGTTALPRVTCTSKLLKPAGRGRKRTQRVKTTCKVTLPSAASRARTVRLRNGGRTLASGRLRAGARTLTLRTVTTAKPRGTFTARLG
jgi:Kelch motif/Collagen triple helix repeat (20 copies)/Galactose oxidase, central domain